MSLVALLSLSFYGWEETSPAVHVEETAAATTAVNSGEGVRNRPSTGSPWRIVNPFLVLNVFLDSRWDVLFCTGRFSRGVGGIA